MQTPIVFLDVDGVLNSRRWDARSGAAEEAGPPTERELWERRIDPECVARLDRLLQRTGAVVVVSSSWRKRLPLNEIVPILEARGFRGRIVGATATEDNTASRGAEITRWLTENDTRGAAYVVLDDEVVEDVPPELVVRPSEGTGLTDQDIDRALLILTGRSGQQVEERQAGRGSDA
jgi:hypothetical protein